MNRALYPIGFLLLVGTIVGAGWVLNNGASKSDSGKDKEPEISVVAAVGYIDVRNGVTQLYPKQFGEVEWIEETKVKEKDGTERDRVFKKGEPILKLKSGMAEYTHKKAQAALRAAQAELTKAKKLPEKHKIDLKNQEAAVEAFKFEKKRLQSELEAKEELLKGLNSEFNKRQRDQVKAALDEAGEKIKIEQGKLEQLKLFDPALEITRAEADVDAKDADVKMAADAVKDFQLVAPFEGTVLHLHTRVGELLGPNPRMAAVEFCPTGKRIVRAEVMQEWGHKVKFDQTALIQDDSYKGAEWKGRVISLAEDYGKKKSPIIEPFMLNDVRTMECIIEFTEEQPPVRIGQRVRVKIEIQKASR
jgi:multidrug resistance efflux pump